MCPPGQAPWSLPNGAAVPALGQHEWTSAALMAAGTGTNAPLCPLSHLPLLPRSTRTMPPSMPRFTAGKGGGERPGQGWGAARRKGMQEGEQLWRGEMREIPEGAQREGSGKFGREDHPFCLLFQQSFPRNMPMARQDDFLWLLTLPVPWDVSHQHFVLLGMGSGGRNPLSLSLRCFPEPCPPHPKVLLPNMFICGCKLRSCGIM